MQRETPTDWAKTPTPKIVNGTSLLTPITTTSRWKNNFYIILYQLQHVYKQIQDVNEIVTGTLSNSFEKVLKCDVKNIICGS